MAVSQRVPSFEELYQAIQALPEGVTGEILEPGMIHTMGRPGGPHRLSSRRIFERLRDEDADRGGRAWWLEQEAQIRFAKGRMAVPDMSGWRLQESDSVPPEFIHDNPIARCPDWCCEILSKSTEKVDRETKLPLYAECGVGWTWIVDTTACCIEVYRNAGGTPELVDKAERDAERAIPPFETVMKCAAFWLPER